VALVIGLARGIVVIMEQGRISDTILYWSEQAVSGENGGGKVGHGSGGVIPLRAAQ
jgi:hypothetical protein